MSDGIQCPYNAWELKLACLSIDDSVFEGRVGELEAMLEERFGAIQNDADLNGIVAKANGITTAELIASPNMAYMVDRFKEHAFLEVISALKEVFGLNDKQAWGLALAGMGELG